MNDTILTPREKRLVNEIAKGNGLNRDELQQLLVSDYPVSKPTLIRDLNKLIEKGLVLATGQGPAVKYLPANTHPFLKYYDLPAYFDKEPDERTVIDTSFDHESFLQLKDFFTEAEKLEIGCQSISAATSNLDDTIVKRELERFTIELSWKSSKIEGNTYSLLETETLIKENQPAMGKSPQEATMILNHKQAFETILANRDSYKNLSISTITQLHNVLIKDLNINSGIRKHAVGVTGTNYRPPDNQWQITEGLEASLKAINTASYPLERALLAIALISYWQPFTDGNKRTGRMLANAVLLAGDCFPLSYRSVDEQEYKQALILFYEQRSMYHLKRLVIEQFHFANTTYFVGK